MQAADTPAIGVRASDLDARPRLRAGQHPTARNTHERACLPTPQALRLRTAPHRSAPAEGQRPGTSGRWHAGTTTANGKRGESHPQPRQREAKGERRWALSCLRVNMGRAASSHEQTWFHRALHFPHPPHRQPMKTKLEEDGKRNKVRLRSETWPA